MKIDTIKARVKPNAFGTPVPDPTMNWQPHLERIKSKESLTNILYRESMGQNRLKFYGDPGDRNDQSERLADRYLNNHNIPEGKIIDKLL
ncbi:MAG: hypothetical protein ABIH76_00755 [Candidatus Bathyarchaeota archaeon]